MRFHKTVYAFLQRKSAKLLTRHWCSSVHTVCMFTGVPCHARLKSPLLCTLQTHFPLSSPVLCIFSGQNHAPFQIFSVGLYFNFFLSPHIKNKKHGYRHHCKLHIPNSTQLLFKSESIDQPNSLSQHLIKYQTSFSPQILGSQHFTWTELILVVVMTALKSGDNCPACFSFIPWVTHANIWQTYTATTLQTGCTLTGARGGWLWALTNC